MNRHNKFALACATLLLAIVVGIVLTQPALKVLRLHRAWAARNR